MLCGINKMGELVCVLCNDEITGYGNNPEPLVYTGRCCDRCNMDKVIIERVKRLKKYMLHQKELCAMLPSLSLFCQLN